jgi:hypothetical protein
VSISDIDNYLANHTQLSAEQRAIAIDVTGANMADVAKIVAQISPYGDDFYHNHFEEYIHRMHKRDTILLREALTGRDQHRIVEEEFVRVIHALFELLEESGGKAIKVDGDFVERVRSDRELVDEALKRLEQIQIIRHVGSQWYESFEPRLRHAYKDLLNDMRVIDFKKVADAFVRGKTKPIYSSHLSLEPLPTDGTE